MLILSEENKKLKGTEHKLPQEIFKLFCEIVKNNPGEINDDGYKKARNVVNKNDRTVTMEWLKNMKHFFTKHNKGESDKSFMLAGGYKVKEWIDTKLDLLTATFNGSTSVKNPMKVRKDTSALGGNRGDHSSESLSIAKSIMSDAIPRFESVNQDNKKIIITEEQLNKVSKIIIKQK